MVNGAHTQGARSAHFARGPAMAASVNLIGPALRSAMVVAGDDSPLVTNLTRRADSPRFPTGQSPPPSSAPSGTERCTRTAGYIPLGPNFTAAGEILALRERLKPLARRVRAHPAHPCPYRGKLGTRPGPAQCPGRPLDSPGGELPRYSGAAGGDYLRAPDLARAWRTTRL